LTKARKKTNATPRCSLDKEAASIAVDFFEQNLTHSKGEMGGKPFMLEPWQRDYVGKLFGTMNGKVRQYRTSLLAIPRKNGKSTLCAGIALKLMFDGEPGAEIYSCAADRDQARLVFEMAKVCVENSPKLRSRLRVFRNSIG
jgi:phage terminase large subunit-like protein